MSSLPAQPRTLDGDWDDQSIDDEIAADMEDGQFVSWEAVKRWMLSWGTEGELSPPEVGD